MPEALLLTVIYHGGEIFFKSVFSVLPIFVFVYFLYLTTPGNDQSIFLTALRYYSWQTQGTLWFTSKTSNLPHCTVTPITLALRIEF